MFSRVLVVVFLFAGLVCRGSLRDCKVELAVVGQGASGRGFDTHIGKTTQTPLDRFPPEIQEQLRKIISATDATGWEHATVVLQVGEQFLVATTRDGKPATSKSDSHVKVTDRLALVASLIGQVNALPASERAKPIKIFDFHTHPQKEAAPGSFARRPIQRDDAGNAYTYVTVPHDFTAQDALMASLASALREDGFTGKIEGAAGPVPAKLERNANPYVALHQAEVQLPPGVNPIFRRFKLPKETKRVPITVGGKTFALGEADGTLRLPGDGNERVGTLYRGSSGLRIQPNDLSPTPLQVNGVTVPSEGMELKKGDVVTVNGTHFAVE